MATNGVEFQVQQWRAEGIEDREIARRLREYGLPDAKIARHLARNPATIFRWLGSRRNALSPQPAKERGHVSPAWPTERSWPGDWTVDHLIRQGIPPDRAAQLLFVAEAGTRWIQWFLVERVNLVGAEAKGLPDETGGPNWLDAIAGLPVLAQWLRCPEAAQLASLIVAKRPYYTDVATPGAAVRAAVSPRRSAEMASRRMAYASAARPLVKAIRDRTRRLAYETALGLDADDRLPMAALNELLGRLPMVDRRLNLAFWRGSGIVRIALWRVFVQIFKHEPANGNGGKAS